jgi:putative oxidoreductase
MRIANEAAILIARTMMSSSMIYYGASKIVDISIFTGHPTTRAFMRLVADGMAAPLWFAYANAIFQTLCGILVLLGMHTRKAAWGLVIWLTVLTVIGHAFWNMTGTDRVANLATFFRNLGLIAAFLMVAVVGPGSLSVDGQRGGGRRRR